MSLLWLDAGHGALLGLYDADLGHGPGLAGPGRASDRQAHPGAGAVHGARPEILPGVACALGAAVLFVFGTVALRSPLGLPPLTATAWQVGLGCVPMVALGMLLEAPDLAR